MSKIDEQEHRFGEDEARMRLHWFKRELAAHEGNIALLHAFSTGRATLKGKGYTKGAEVYEPSLADKQRLPRTLANLNEQCTALLLEIQNLKQGYDL
jgi:hypothetical protein